ncbi:MAG: DUF3187 family protein [Nitrospirae bacterium]|nr:DUF3187 family protein [Nitrospirota bacterium]
MIRVCKSLVSAALFLTCLSSVAFSFDGPLQINNLYPIFLHADQPYLEKAEMENSMSFSLSHSSTYTIETSGEWIINLDMEITELSFRYKRIIKNLIEFDLDVSVLVFSDGFLDSYLEDYHDTFGFPDYGRKNRPHNDFLYEVRRDGKLIIEGERGTRLGDIRLAAKKPLMSASDYKLSVKGDIEAPVSSAKKGYSNGSMDSGISLLFDKRISDSTMTYWNLGAVFPGDVKGHEDLNLNNYVNGGIAVETVLKKNLDLIVQLHGQSEIYPGTGISAVDGSAFFIAFGGRYYSAGGGNYELSLTEDLNTSGSPDFIVNLTYKHLL